MITMNHMINKSALTVIGVLFIYATSLAWGLTGHRVIGEVAQHHLSPSAEEKVSKVLKGASLAEVSNWMDEVKSDRAYDSLRPWHYVTIPDGMTYETSDINPKGDVIFGIEFVVDQLKKGGLTPKLEADYLKILVHLVGDLHQPLHVGRETDRGGNDIKVEWFWKSSNIHRVWDSQLIDDKKYSYTELTAIVNKADKTQVAHWQTGTVRDWAHEAMSYRKQIYDMPSDKKLSYEYSYKNWATVKLQLAKGGVRLAALLNDIYNI